MYNYQVGNSIFQKNNKLTIKLVSLSLKYFLMMIPAYKFSQS